MRVYYRMGEKLQPFGDQAPAQWENILAVLSPEAAFAVLPENLRASDFLNHSGELRFCRLMLEGDKIGGHFHVPARQKQAAHDFSVVWWNGNLLFVDRDGFVQECVQRVLEMRPHKADGADNFLVDFLLVLIAGDLAYIQQLEERTSGLEQAVLNGKTESFINQMSMLRKELNRFNRYYAQLMDVASFLQENAADLLDASSQQRLGYFSRRIFNLREETQMLREYASQVSSEYQAQVDIAQNRTMKLLTVVTTLFLPLSLIVGWYGMNFVNMPELRWTYGYPAVAVLSLAVVLLCLLFFWKNGGCNPFRRAAPPAVGRRHCPPCKQGLYFWRYGLSASSGTALFLARDIPLKCFGSEGNMVPPLRPMAAKRHRGTPFSNALADKKSAPPQTSPGMLPRISLASISKFSPLCHANGSPPTHSG